MVRLSKPVTYPAESISTKWPPCPRRASFPRRAWARGQGMDVTDRGRLRPEIWEAYRRAHT